VTIASVVTAALRLSDSVRQGGTLRIRDVLLFSALIGLSPQQVVGQSCPPSLIGIWGAEAWFGPEVRGEISIVQSGSSYRASVGGTTVLAARDGDRLTFALPGNRGEFRGRLMDPRSLFGQWIQPPAAHVWGTRYATPVVLSAATPGVWRGQLRPLDDGESIYLRIQADSAGDLRAISSNPERNLGRYLGQMRVSCQGQSIIFLREAGDTLRASLDQESGVLSLYLPTETATFDLTRRIERDAPGFFARPTMSYTYAAPIPRGDGWPIATLDDVGIDSAKIQSWIAQIVGADARSIESPFLQAILIARHGKLVLEEYFHGYQADRVHDVRSAGKSLTATLLGAALRLDPTLSVRRRVVDFFPQYEPLANDGPQKRAMTVENLLTMKSGLAADDDDDQSPGNENRLDQQRDRFKFALDLPMAGTPGVTAAYSAATINLVGPVVEHSSGMWLPEFIYAHFARPLDIEHYHVPIGSNSDAYMAGGMLMRPRDFMKLGQLYLSGGTWRGRRVVDPSWVQAATKAHSRMGPGEYGYGWWLRDVLVGSRSYRTYRAAGNGGQLVIVVPDLDLVVAFMGANYNQGPVWWPWNDALVPEVIIPAISRSSSAGRE